MRDWSIDIAIAAREKAQHRLSPVLAIRMLRVRIHELTRSLVVCRCTPSTLPELGATLWPIELVNNVEGTRKVCYAANSWRPLSLALQMTGTMS